MSTRMDNEENVDNETELKCTDRSKIDKNEKKKRKPGIVYLATIPSCMTASGIREFMSQFGKVGRVFLQRAAEQGLAKKRVTRANYYSEGWIEFLSKRVAKEVVSLLNNKQISLKKRSRHFDELWNMKYLPRFKWVHLTERLEYERAILKQRMRIEIAQAKREADHFAESVELSEKLKRKLKKKPLSAMTIGYSQRKTEEEFLAACGKNSADEKDRTEFLRGLFANRDS